MEREYNGGGSLFEESWGREEEEEEGRASVESIRWPSSTRRHPAIKSHQGETMRARSIDRARFHGGDHRDRLKTGPSKFLVNFEKIFEEEKILLSSRGFQGLI